jgi:hypothetical protein
MTGNGDRARSFYLLEVIYAPTMSCEPPFRIFVSTHNKDGEDVKEAGAGGAPLVAHEGR